MWLTRQSERVPCYARSVEQQAREFGTWRYCKQSPSADSAVNTVITFRPKEEIPTWPPMRFRSENSLVHYGRAATKPDLRLQIAPRAGV